MRFYIPQCRYCKYNSKVCPVYSNIRECFKNINCFDVKSIKVNCKEYEPIAKIGDIIEFEMCGNIIKRPIKDISQNNKTYIVITAKNSKNKELFTNVSYDYQGNEIYKKYFDDSEYLDLKDNLMLGFVNYKFIKQVVKNVKIPNMEKPILNYGMFDFLKAKK